MLYFQWGLVALMLDNKKSIAGVFRSVRIFKDMVSKWRKSLTYHVGENIGSSALEKLDNFKIKDERGYLLIESLLGLILLSIIALSLITALPILLDANARLDKEQAIYHRLFELHDREIEGSHVITEPYEFQVFRRHDEWCAIYVWSDGIEKTICL